MEVRVSMPAFKLEVAGTEDEAWVRGDRIRIQQVLTNLLTNAVKYSDKHKEARVCIDREDGRAMVKVTDYGIGIPEEQQKDVFGLYFRGANVSAKNYGGLGLGLFISKSILDRHGGTITVESSEGEGSTFCFSLPVHQSEPSETARSERSSTTA